jgi:Tfp pilus assembly protein PilV
MTLIEVTLAITVLTAGLVSLLMVLTAAMQQKETSREVEYASNAAVTKMEEIRGYAGVDFTTLASRYSSSTYNEFCSNCGVKHTAVSQCNNFNTRAGLKPQSGRYNTGFITINSSMPTLVEVTVDIAWESNFGQSNLITHTMNTMVARSSK